MVRDAVEKGIVRRGRSNVELPVDLAAVGRDDLRVEPFGDVDAKLCLANGCRPGDGEDGLVA